MQLWKELILDWEDRGEWSMTVLAKKKKKILTNFMLDIVLFYIIMTKYSF